MKKVIFLVGLLSLAGCGAIYSPSPLQRGHIAIIADADGMRAFGDSQIGLINESKTPPDIKGSYFQHRDLTEQEETKRKYAPSLLQGLFASPEK